MNNTRWVLGTVAVYALIMLTVTRGVPAHKPILLEPLQPEDALADVRAQDGGARQGIPLAPEAWQKTPPCDTDMGEVAINGACFVELAKRPPCGRLPEHAGRCYRAIAKVKREPTSINP